MNLGRFIENGSFNSRTTIIQALCRLIEKKGASSTSLSDIAREAGMTVSHLLYYFPSKDALLDEVYSSFSASLKSRITSPSNAKLSPEERCKLLADNLLVLELSGLDREIIFEMIAYAVHSPRFRRTQQRHTEKFFYYLKDLFEQTRGTGGFSAEETAAIIGSLWVGTLIFSYFCKPLTEQRAKKLFRRALHHFAGLENQDRQAKVPTRKSRHVKQGQGRSSPYRQGD